MADKRINALANTASSTASDDFIAVDGTTNGTRKLSAFSPTFGGNATVTGTLTVNGTNPSSIPRLSLNSPVSETYNFGAIGTIQSADVTLEATSTAATALGIGLVVRRTNGGEFARFINGAITTQLANMSCDAAGTYFSISSAVGMYLTSTKTMLTGGNVLIGGTTDIPGTGGLKVFGTTASTTTSTGALVVGNGTSGGLGVGGAIHSGSNIRATGNLYAGDSSVSTGAVSIQVGDSRTGSGFAHLDLVGDTTYSDYGLRIIRGNGGANTTSTVTHRGTGALQITTEESASIVLSTASTTALTITSAQKAEFASTIKTAAPSGGTAAEWKLGTVATVSPTSPNRTIEVDIGGTIYYLAAKTTNN